jgi:alpha-L-arabinofuranosidase
MNQGCQKLVMTQPATSLPSTSRVQEAQSRVDFLRRVLSEVRQQIEAERSNLPVSEDVLQANILKAELRLEKIQQKIDKEKQTCKKRKQEIDEWKRWYHSIAHLEKTQERHKLEIEIHWRSQAISEGEIRISQFESEKLVAILDLDKCKIQLAAFVNGVYDQPIEADPRLIEAESVLREAQDELKAAQAQA